MKMKMHILVRFILVVFMVGSTVSVWANGFLLPNQDAFATARGEAFTATADNASAIFYNPAGIAQLEGHNFRAGCYGLYLDPTYKNSSGTTFDNDKNYHAIPQFFYAYSPENSLLSYGLGVYSPFGLSSEWPQDTGFRTIATKGSITYVRINPVIALKLAPNLSIGGGVTINYADADLEQGLTPIPNNDNFKFTGDGWDVGYNLGLLWKPHEKISIGATFRSATTINLDGHTEFYSNGGYIPAFPNQRVGADADFSFPLSAVFGISYRPTPKWNLEFNADYTDWSSVGTLTIKQSAPFPPLLPQNVSLPLNWEPSWLYKFGATRYLGNGWQVSAGYVFNESSVPDSNYSPLVADLDRHFFSIGTGHKGKRFDFDIAYQFCYGPEHSVSESNPNMFGQSANGDYEFTSHAVLLTLGLHF